MKIDINELRRLALDGDLAAMQEIILCLKAVEKERDALHAALQHEADCVEACKSEIERLRAENVGLVDDMNLLRDNNAALRARIEEMEKQEPLITVLREPDYWSGGHFHKGTRPYISLRQMSKLKIGQKLYALPGAQGE